MKGRTKGTEIGHWNCKLASSAFIVEIFLLFPKDKQNSSKFLYGLNSNDYVMFEIR